MKESDKYHRWVEWSKEDRIYLGKCPDLVTGIHGEDPIVLYSELCTLIEDVVNHFKAAGRDLPPVKVRPMSEVA
ncbi:pilus assembly protein HicB [Candidatus Thiosymbion oneisti]|uniref:pilus assembly protein HicB n=1 Tax=Candidatus Thiosymbion oneisti TaxID=589554 RepID=UPI00105C26D4|nr:pilus assembly protein HicB [Candidatus Thiosymbion oneisti]